MNKKCTSLLEDKTSRSTRAFINNSRFQFSSHFPVDAGQKHARGVRKRRKQTSDRTSFSARRKIRNCASCYPRVETGKRSVKLARREDRRQGGKRGRENARVHARREYEKRESAREVKETRRLYVTEL